MSMRKRNLAWLTAGMLWALTAGLPATADDTELFVGDSTLYPSHCPTFCLFWIRLAPWVR